MQAKDVVLTTTLILGMMPGVASAEVQLSCSSTQQRLMRSSWSRLSTNAVQSWEAP